MSLVPVYSSSDIARDLNKKCLTAIAKMNAIGEDICKHLTANIVN